MTEPASPHRASSIKGKRKTRFSSRGGKRGTRKKVKEGGDTGVLCTGQRSSDAYPKGRAHNQRIGMEGEQSLNNQAATRWKTGSRRETGPFHRRSVREQHSKEITSADRRGEEVEPDLRPVSNHLTWVKPSLFTRTSPKLKRK